MMRRMVNRAALLTLIVVAALVALVQLDPVPVRSQKTVVEQPARHASGVIPEATKQQDVVAYGKLPLSFEPNQGQTDSRVKFLSRGSGYTLFLTSTEAVLALRSPRAKPSAADHGAATRPEPPAQRDVLRIRLVGANPAPQMTGLDALPGKSNYFIGKDPQKWRKNVPHYAKVNYEEVYPDIDLVFYGNQRRLEYDFVVAPGADPGAIALGFEGADRLEIDSQGDLVVHMAGGAVRFQKPVVYQELDGVREEISGHYAFKSDNRIGFQIAAYDASKPLIIDPELAYSTYLGGEYSDGGHGIAVDSYGNVYVTGSTRSPDFPETQGTCELSETGVPCETAFVTKLEAVGTDFVFGYSTYLGGSAYGSTADIAVDGAGNAYVTGYTGSTDFPTTGGPLQPACTPTVSYYGESCEDAFVAKLNADGYLVYSTYLGGNGFDYGYSVGLKPGCTPVCLIYVVGSTSSADFATPGAFQTTLGGKGDAFLVLIDPDPMDGGVSILVYSTYFGGSEGEAGFGVAVDGAGNAYVTGHTGSTDFPTTVGALQPYCAPTVSKYGVSCEDAFVAKLDPAGNGAGDLVYATYLGGTDRDAYHNGDVAVDVDGFLYVTGNTASPDFPTTVGAFQPTHNGAYNAFVAKLSQDGSDLVYSTYLGGSEGTEEAYGIAVQPGCPKELAKGCSAYVTGQTSSPDFPTTGGAFQSTIGWVGDPFVIKLNPSGSELLYSTYFGGSTFKQNDDGSRSGPGEYGWAIALDAAGHAYVTGTTGSDDFPTLGAFDTNCGDDAIADDCAERSLTDAFIAKFKDGPGIHIGGMELVERSSGKRMWRATVGVELHRWDEETPGGEADVMGEWRGSAGYQLAALCITDAMMGVHTCSSGDIPNRNDPVVFTVTDVRPRPGSTSLSYDASANHDPGPDSNGTQITVFKSEKGSGDGGGGGKPCNPRKETCS